MNHALIEVAIGPGGAGAASGRVVDLFAGPLSDLYAPPQGHIVVESDTARMGDVYDAKAGTFGAPPLAEPSLGDLLGYAEAKQGRVLNGGITVDVGEGTMADVSSTNNGRGLVNGCIGLADLAAKMGAPEPVFPWINNDGTKLTLTVAQMQTIALTLGQFVQETYSALGDATAGIAGGTIKDFAAIDALPWPANA
jgi:hypothetical protein